MALGIKSPGQGVKVNFKQTLPQVITGKVFPVTLINLITWKCEATRNEFLSPKFVISL